MSTPDNIYWSDRSQWISDRYKEENGYTPEQRRLELTLKFLRKHHCQSVLDCGCGSGHTLATLLENGFDALGCDFSTQMLDTSKAEALRIGHSTSSVFKWDLTLPFPREANFELRDAALLLSVLPYIEDWKNPLQSIKENVLSPNGYLIASFPNELFDLFTSNNYTAGFIQSNLLDQNLTKEQNETIQHELRKQFNTNAEFKPESAYSGKIYFKRENPLSISQRLEPLGFQVEEIQYMNYHPIPPKYKSIIGEQDYEKLKLETECNLSCNDWQMTFTCSTFLVLARSI